MFLCDSIIAPSTMAHTIYLNYHVEEVEIEVYFGGGVAAQEVEVTVYDPDGDPFLTGYTDDNGKFSFEPGLKSGEWKIAAEHSGHRIEKTFLGGTEDDGGDMPLYSRILAGFGYLMGIAGLAIGYVAWRDRRKRNNDTVS